MTLDGDYDYIVVGAGSAGCVVANRLSADPTKRVLLLEAGGQDDWIWFHIPVGYLFLIGNPRSDWMFETEAEPGLNGRKLNYPRGKAIGGSSSINAMISMRGQAGDYDQWRQLGLTGWGWNDVQPVFRQLDRHFLGDSEHHSACGELSVEAPRVRWDILDAVADAAEEMGIPKTPDFNTGDNTGSCYFHVNQKRGRRWSAARGFLKPVLGRSNLRLETDVAVEKVLFDGRRASGVRFRRGNEMIEAHAKGEVILCAGAIGSVQVLQRSGIGPARMAQELGRARPACDGRRGPQFAGPSAAARHVSRHGREDAERDLLFAAGPAADGPAIWAVPARADDHGGVATGHLHQVRSWRRNAPISSSISSLCRWTGSARRCTAFPPLPSAPATCAPPRAATVRADLGRSECARPASGPIIFPPMRTAASPPMPSA